MTLKSRVGAAAITLPIGCEAGVATLLLGGMVSQSFPSGVTSYCTPDYHFTYARSQTLVHRYIFILRVYNKDWSNGGLKGRAQTMPRSVL